MNHYRVYAEFSDEHDTEAPTPQTAIENFKAYLELFTIEEILEKMTFGVDDLTENTRAEVINWE
jgi:hypothetical protein